MRGLTYIQQKQISWAGRKKIVLFGSQGNRGAKIYTDKLD